MSDFFDITNRRADKKARADIRALGARIDNIIAHNNDTDGNTELVDIRTGADGTIYTTAGLAVRTQFGKIDNIIQNVFNISNNIINLETCETGSISNAGEETTYSEYVRTDYIAVDNVPAYITKNISGYVKLAQYDSNKTFIRIWNYNEDDLYTWGIADDNVKYIRLVFPVSVLYPMAVIDYDNVPQYQTLEYVPFGKHINKDWLMQPVAELTNQFLPEDELDGMIKNYLENDDVPLRDTSIIGGLCSVFKKIGVIGDSLSSGCLESRDANNNVIGTDHYEYSWIQYIAKMCGNTAYNFSVGGLKANTFWSTSNQNVRNLRENGSNYLCDAYFIALGVNDIADTNISVGTSADIEDSASTSFYGNYSRIIKLILSLRPDAKIFLVGLPNHNKMTVWGRRFRDFRDAIEDMANYFPSCYYLDLYNYDVAYDDDFQNTYFNGFHENVLGYVRTAQTISKYVDWIIRHHPNDFKNIGYS